MSIKDGYIKDLANKLARDGRKLIETAYLKADFGKDKTQNLHDSYGSAVYYNYKIYPNTKSFFTPMSSTKKKDPNTGEKISGREAIEDFFATFKPSSDGMQLVVVVAMFYGGILEAGQYPLKRKYNVIFMIGDDIRALAAKIKKASVYKIQDGRVAAL